jgi:NADH-quinone oxidoreductase subunit J
MNEIIMIILLGLLVLSSVVAVFLRSLLKSAIALAATSVVLTIIMFVLGSPLAAVFELSICAGLITAVFVSAISMTDVMSRETIEEKRKLRRRRFIFLPIILVLIAAGLILSWPSLQLSIANIPVQDLSAQSEIWNIRQLDMVGQIIIIIAGVLGVAVLFKERGEKEK